MHAGLRKLGPLRALKDGYITYEYVSKDVPEEILKDYPGAEAVAYFPTDNDDDMAVVDVRPISLEGLSLEQPSGAVEHFPG